MCPVASVTFFPGAVAEKLDLSLLLRKRAHIIGSTLRNRSASFKTQLVGELQVCIRNPNLCVRSPHICSRSVVLPDTRDFLVEAGL